MDGINLKPTAINNPKVIKIFLKGMAYGIAIIFAIPRQQQNSERE